MNNSSGNKIEIDFYKNNDRCARLAINNNEVTFEDEHGITHTQNYENETIAAIVFENIATVFEDGKHEEAISCDDSLPGIFTLVGEDDDRCWVLFENTTINKLCIYEADPVSVWDGLLPEVQAAKPLPHFDPKNADPATLGLHLLRRFIIHPSSGNCTEFALQLGIKIDEILNRLSNSNRNDKLTHLEIYDFWNSGNPVAEPRCLASQFPNIKRLLIPYWSCSMFVTKTFDQLRWIVLSPGPGWVSHGCPHPFNSPLQDILDMLLNFVPALKILSIPHRNFDKADLETLAAHPLIMKLDVLDLFMDHGKLDFPTLLALKPQLQHLEKIIVGSHLIDKKTINETFKDWPQVIFTTYNRQNSAVKELDAHWIFNENRI